MKILVKKITPDAELPLLLEHETGFLNLLYKGYKEACSYCKGVGHWKSDCEILIKIIQEKKVRKGVNKMGGFFKSTEPEKVVGPESTAPIGKILPFETTAATKTNDGDKKISEATKIEPNHDYGISCTTSVRTIRDNTGLKKPPASSIAMIKPESRAVKKVSSDYGTVPEYSTINSREKTPINANKIAIETEDYEE
ncbi:hypothetical protein AYI69_g9105 [Smittium culicis]|uniref:CCHC-type domain-containing protein n=1 Tax=Smittium culicis TaxID=133412 RepID=A0A1R1XF04_9FUNG|nr:hypothetical protein AYI69_g9105 [Smittium culicis]